MKVFKLFSIVTLMSLSVSASATGLFVEAGVHLGGDTLIDSGSTVTGNEDLKAGQFLSLAVGGHTALTKSLEGRASFGYKFDSTQDSNGSFRFSRYPIEFLVMQAYGKWKFGGGLAYHLTPRVNQGVVTTDFDDALGYVLAVDHTIKDSIEQGWFVGGRITIIDYENQALSVSGNSIGVVLGYLF